MDRKKNQTSQMVIDDFSGTGLVSALGTRWRGTSDRVMGGVSRAVVDLTVVDGVHCLRLSGDVRLDNRGGFIQAALDLATTGQTLDASAYAGLRLRVRGNAERYSVHLRTADGVRAWQSYRATFIARPEWEVVDLPFETFTPHRLDAALDVTRLRRLGLVAIGRAFQAELLVAEVAFYRSEAEGGALVRHPSLQDHTGRGGRGMSTGVRFR
jgi:adhesin HecA-like repeat protein